MRVKWKVRQWNERPEEEGWLEEEEIKSSEEGDVNFKEVASRAQFQEAQSKEEEFQQIMSKEVAKIDREEARLKKMPIRTLL